MDGIESGSAGYLSSRGKSISNSREHSSKRGGMSFFGKQNKKKKSQFAGSKQGEVMLDMDRKRKSQIIGGHSQ